MREKLFNTIETTSEEKRVVSAAELYAEFPAIKDAFSAMENVLDGRENDPEFEASMRNTLEGLARGYELLKLSLHNQDALNLADKRWVRSRDFMEHALQSGRLSMELDIRLDAEGKPWVSHATGMSGNPLAGKIHTASSEQMAEGGSRFSLEEALDLFSKYKSHGHRLILELKSLGSDVSEFQKNLRRLEVILSEADATEQVAVSSLAPGLLMATHEAMPRMPLILNGGIAPIVSYSKVGEWVGENLVPEDSRWRAFGLAPFGELVVAAGVTPERPDGHGIHTGYAMTRLPQAFIDVMRQQREDDIKFGGIVSLSAVHNLANILEGVGAKAKASQLRRYYKNVIDELGLGAMATTWGQEMGKVPGLSYLSPERQIETFRREFGALDLIYTKGPEKFAHTLSSETFPELARDSAVYPK